jgi:glutamine---fructose-6-phosphate transaminase (isomerizing)
MCGIIGYLGLQNPVEVIFEGLKKLEYRGYDSAGIALIKNEQFEVRRSQGKLSELGRLLAQNPVSGRIGIGHTRWATHGRPSETNAHPHVAGRIALVHNGIIENYLDLKKQLSAEGCQFSSETDSEIVAHLIDKYIKKGQPLIKAVQMAQEKIQGSYALVIMDSQDPDRIVALRKECPLIVGIGDGEFFIASDVLAFLHHTNRVIYLEDGEMAVLEKPFPQILSSKKGKIKKEVQKITWSPVMAEKAGYKHFMQKEIFEQPQAIIDTFRGRVSPEKGEVLLPEIGLTAEGLKDIDQIHIIACGTSWHAALVGKFLLEEYCRIPTAVDYASEYRYRNPIINPRTLLILISQSGETADTLAALREGKKKKARVLAICNVVGSSIAREADGVIYTHAGPEIGVASTKAFTTQLVALYLMTLYIGQTLKRITRKDRLAMIQELLRIPHDIEEVLEAEGRIQAIAQKYFQAQDFLYLARGIHYPIALEGALKLKEISYIHAEGYPAGEMKHGPIALIDEKMPTVFLAPRNEIQEKVFSNMEEVRARGGIIISFTDEKKGNRPEFKAQEQIRLPRVEWGLSPIIYSIPMQLLAYHIAVLRGTDVDQPRNLAKSVTVE